VGLFILVGGSRLSSTMGEPSSLVPYFESEENSA